MRKCWQRCFGWWCYLVEFKAKEKVTTIHHQPIIIIIIEKTDAGLNGLYIRDINLLYDFINIYMINTKLYGKSLELEQPQYFVD